MILGESDAGVGEGEGGCLEDFGVQSRGAGRVAGVAAVGSGEGVGSEGERGGGNGEA